MANEAIKFTNPDVDARYVALIGVDKMIQKPGTYNGKLSNITPEMAKGMVERGSNLIAEKPVNNTLVKKENKETPKE